jgi:hypothetical protein
VQRNLEMNRFHTHLSFILLGPFFRRPARNAGSSPAALWIFRLAAGD